MKSNFMDHKSAGTVIQGMNPLLKRVSLIYKIILNFFHIIVHLFFHLSY